MDQWKKLNMKKAGQRAGRYAMKKMDTWHWKYDQNLKQRMCNVALVMAVLLLCLTIFEIFYGFVTLAYLNKYTDLIGDFSIWSIPWQMWFCSLPIVLFASFGYRLLTQYKAVLEGGSSIDMLPMAKTFKLFRSAGFIGGIIVLGYFTWKIYGSVDELSLAIKKNMQGNMDGYNEDMGKRKIVDDLQYDHKCCGIGQPGWQIWLEKQDINGTKMPKSTQNRIPFSCCRHEIRICQVNEITGPEDVKVPMQMYSSGCDGQVKSNFKYWTHYLFWYRLFQYAVLAILLNTCGMIRDGIKHEYEYRDRPPVIKVPLWLIGSCAFLVLIYYICAKFYLD